MKAADFKAALNREAQKVVPQLAKDAQYLIATGVSVGILMTTPVLTGQARGNWNFSIDEVDLSHTLGKVAGVKETGAPLTAQERANIGVFKKVQSLPLGRKIFMANSLPYIEGLDTGTSQKAPAGIVDVAIHGVLEGAKVRSVRS